MATKIKFLEKYQVVAASSTAERVVIPPSGKTYSVKSVSMTGPQNGKSAVMIKWNNNTVEAAQGDKSAQTHGLIVEGDGSKELKIVLDNSNGDSSVYLGSTIYYEEIG